VVELGATSDREFLCFNQNTNLAKGKPLVTPHKLAWFCDKRFRQAVSHAIDRERIAREVYKSRARPTFGFISEENPRWHNPNIPQFTHDPAKARARLADLGLTDRDQDGVAEDADGRKVEFRLHSNSGNPLREATARLIVQDLKAVGIQATYLPEEFNALIERVSGSFDYDCALMGLGGGGIEPASQVNVLLSSSALHQWFPMQTTPATAWEARVDELTMKQMRTLDFAERKKAFDEVQLILAEQLPLIYTTSPLAVGAIRADVQNLRPSVHAAYRLTWNIEELYRTAR
jgi:peptide/nickel transport system substrate-binding protein